MKRVQIQILLMIILLGNATLVIGMKRLLATGTTSRGSGRIVSKVPATVKKTPKIPVKSVDFIKQQSIEQPSTMKLGSFWQKLQVQKLPSISPSTKSYMWMTAFVVANTMLPFPIIIIPVDKVTKWLKNMWKKN